MGLTSEEFHRSLNNIADNYLRDMQHIREKRAQSESHHQEMMALLDRFHELKQHYKKLADAYDNAAAARDAAFAIIREHEAEMGISADYVNARIKEFQTARKAELAAKA